MYFCITLLCVKQHFFNNFLIIIIIIRFISWSFNTITIIVARIKAPCNSGPKIIFFTKCIFYFPDTFRIVCV